MRKVVVMPDGNWLSHVSRPLEITKALRELGGYQIVFAGNGEYMRLPRECGFEVRPVLTHDPDHVMRCSRSGRANWWDYPTLATHVEADLEVFTQEKPDLVLGDFRLSLCTSCELAKIPLSVILNAAWTDYYSAQVRAPEHLWVTRALGRLTDHPPTSLDQERHPPPRQPPVSQVPAGARTGTTPQHLGRVARRSQSDCRHPRLRPH